MTLNINNQEDIFSRLKNLDKDATPQWGLMTPQHIVEHLAFSVAISSGKGPQHLYSQQEVADAIKQKIIYTDAELTPGVKNPILGDELPALVHKDMQAAIENLKAELDYFEEYFNTNPQAKTTQPRMGLMDKTEWITLHNKHFTHHFKQYNLV